MFVNNQIQHVQTLRSYVESGMVLQPHNILYRYCTGGFLSKNMFVTCTDPPREGSGSGEKAPGLRGGTAQFLRPPTVYASNTLYILSCAFQHFGIILQPLRHFETYYMLMIIFTSLTGPTCCSRLWAHEECGGTEAHESYQIVSACSLRCHIVVGI